MSVAVVGSFMYDLIADAPRQPKIGETLKGLAFRRSVGGKGYNQAVAAARAGAKVAMVGMLGDDPFGEEFRAALRAEGIDDRYVETGSGDNSGTGVGMPMVFPDGHNAIVIIPQANEKVDDSVVKDAAEVISSANVVLMQLETTNEAVLEAARMGHSAGAKVILNPTPYHSLPAELWKQIDLFTPNEGELEACCRDLDIPLGESVEDTVSRFVSKTGVSTIVTCGGDGSVYGGTNGEIIRCPALKMKAVDTVGAGDTYCGALAAALDGELPIEKAIEYASAAASISVTRKGSGTSAPTEAEIKDAISANAGK